MKVEYKDLDATIKDMMRNELQRVLVLQFKTLPLPGQDDMVREVCTESMIDNLKSMIINYYLLETERDLDVSISPEDMVKLYYRTA